MGQQGKLEKQHRGFLVRKVNGRQMQKISLSYHIKSYECDRNGDLRLLTLMNILQDVADTHASALDMGIEHCLKHGLAWVGSNYHLKIERMPKWHEKIEVTSWPAVEKKLSAIRDFVITDAADKPIVVASSQWVLVDVTRKKPVSLRENLPLYAVIDERALFSNFVKIADVEKVDTAKEFDVLYDDIDVNNHVNNAVYPLWATESLERNFRQNHTPEEIEIAFKKEGLYGERVISECQSDALHTLHSIRSLNDNRELAKLKVLWKKRA